jgi:hypothetical protein
MNDPPTKETINCLDDEGKTPFLSYIDSFSKNIGDLYAKVQARIN